MTESGYGHLGRIPHYGGRGQPDSRAMPEPPACIQNAMMTKDKKPFTYTPGGLDLSQIRTPSMARRLARQRSQEEQEQAYAAQQSMANGGQQPPRGGGGPPPPPPFQGGPPPPPPPPPLVIQTPAPGAAKPETVIRPIGERPEIVIPENPIGMLRKTNSPYHWEQEKAEKERLGAVPKFVEKAPSPVMQQNPLMSFSQQPPATYTPQIPNNIARQNYPYGSAVNQSPESPLHKPEPQYPAKPSLPSPGANVQTPTRDLLQRQDSQFNKSPTPFGPHGISSSPVASNGSPNSPNQNNPWRQQERRESPAVSASTQQRSPFSPTNSNRSPQFTPSVNNQSPIYQNESPSPSVYHTLPRASPRVQDNYTNNLRQSPPRNLYNNTIYNNVRNEPRPESPKVDPSNAAPWRSNTLNRNHRDVDNNNYYQPSNNQTFGSPPFGRPNEPPAQQNNIQQNPWKANNQNEANQWKQSPQNEPNLWRANPQNENTASPVMSGQLPGEVRYQTHMSIPVTPRKTQQEQERPQPQQTYPQPQSQQQPQPHPNKEVVFVTQEPVYYHKPESPKSVPPWVKSQKDKTPPPEWCQRPLDGRKSLTRELVSPPRERQVEPEWVQKSNELRGAPRDLSSPPLVHQTVQPTWSTKPSDNRKSQPRDTQPTFENVSSQNGHGSRVIPVQMEVSSKEFQDGLRRGGDQQPQLRIIIDMQQNPQGQSQAQPPYSQPTQRIMRVLSPQLVRMDQQEGPPQQDLPALNNSQPRTRIIPIQLEGGGNEAPNRRIFYHHFASEAPPRQSKAFRVLQTITGTLESEIQDLENSQGFSDL